MGILKQSDFDARIEAAREIVKKNRLDALVVFSTECEPAQVRYFADYWPSFETAAVRRGDGLSDLVLLGSAEEDSAMGRNRIWANLLHAGNDAGAGCKSISWPQMEET